MGKIMRFINRFNKFISENQTLNTKRVLYRAIYEQNAYENISIGVEKNNDKSVIISLTTYGERINSVHIAIESLFEQTKKADRIILWLDENEFIFDDLPLVLKKMINRGLEIKFCPNYKSYKKLIPVLMLQEHALIITVDDDIIYPRTMIENMIKTHNKYPDCVVFNYGLEILLNKKGEPLAYEKWRAKGDFCFPSLKYIGIGCGGILYPENVFHSDIFSIENIFDLAPTTDDLWFKFMTYLNDVKYVQTNFGPKIESEVDFLENFLTIDKIQKQRLGDINVSNGQNDVQLKKIIEKYNIIFN